MRKILVPIDFSLPSEYATKFASKIAKKSDSEIYLLHMVELPTGIIDMGAGSNFSIPKSMMYLKKIKEKILNYKSEHFSKKQLLSMLFVFKLLLMEYKIIVKKLKLI